MTHADMPVSVNDLLPRQDPIGDYKVLDQRVEITHPFPSSIISPATMRGSTYSACAAEPRLAPGSPTMLLKDGLS
jgi:hypothetical protein